ncbi:MAG TPA: P-loop NTPase [Desulfobacterales bacterium]|nr:P-loop NTPase [Desulfobacterales bacterium]
MSNSSKDFDPPFQKNMDSGAAEQDRVIHDPLSLILQKYIVTSNKRSVGKTSLAANLAVALSKRKVKVGLIDLDLHGTNISNMLGLQGICETNADKQFVPETYSDYLKVISIGSIMKDVDQSVIWRRGLKSHVIRQFIADVNWGDLDYLIIDSISGTGDEPLAVAQAIQDAKVIFVSAPEKEYLPRVRKQVRELIVLYENAQNSILGFVENMSGLFCKNCDKTGEGMIRESNIMNVRYLGRIPLDPNMPYCTAAGQSYLEKYPNFEAAHGYELLVDKIIEDSRLQKSVIKKIAIPISEGRLFPSFGKATEFAIFHIQNQQIIKKDILHPPPHGPDVLPDWLHDLGVSVIIAGNMGPKAMENFRAKGTTVIIGSSSTTSPDELVQQHLSRNR